MPPSLTPGLGAVAVLGVAAGVGLVGVAVAATGFSVVSGVDTTDLAAATCGAAAVG